LHRRSRTGFKKAGMLALAMLIALGALGVSYAAWTDSVYIEGTVNTGTLDIDICGVSSTFVYKVPHASDTGFGPETVVHYVYGQTDPHPPAGGTLIASAVTVPDDTTDADWATMTLSGIFPEIDFMADVELQYLGSIPAKISMVEIYANEMSDTTIAALWQRGKDTKDDPIRYGAWVDGDVSTNGLIWTSVGNPLGLQLHQFDLVHVTLHIRIPQGEEQFLNISNLGFTGIITVTQWNEVE